MAKATKKAKTGAKKSPAKKAPAKKAPLKGTLTRHLEEQYGHEFTEGMLIDDLDRDLKDAWKKLRAFAAGLGDQRIYPSVKAIMFAKKVCYFYVRPRKKFLEVWFFLPRKVDGLIFMQTPTKKEKYCNLYKISHADQVEEPLTDWLREAFDFAADL